MPLFLPRGEINRFFLWLGGGHGQVEINEPIDKCLGIVNCRLGQFFVIDDKIDKITGRVDLGGVNVPSRRFDLQVEIKVVVVGIYPLREELVCLTFFNLIFK